MSQDAPTLLLAHHLKALKLPTFLRDYASVAEAECDKLPAGAATEALRRAPRALLDSLVDF